MLFLLVFWTSGWLSNLEQVKPGFTNYLPRGLAKNYVIFIIKSSENFQKHFKKIHVTCQMFEKSGEI